MNKQLEILQQHRQEIDRMIALIHSSAEQADKIVTSTPKNGSVKGRKINGSLKLGPAEAITKTEKRDLRLIEAVFKCQGISVMKRKHFIGLIYHGNVGIMKHTADSRTNRLVRRGCLIAA